MERQSRLLTTPPTSSLWFLRVASDMLSLSCSTYVERARRQVEAAPCSRITWTPPSWTCHQPASWAPRLRKTQHLWSPALLAWGSALDHHLRTCIPADISLLHGRQVWQRLTQQDDLHHTSKGTYVSQVWLYPVEELIWSPPLVHRHPSPLPRIVKGVLNCAISPKVPLVATLFGEGEYGTDEMIQTLRLSQSSFIRPATSSFALSNITVLMFLSVPFSIRLTHFPDFTL